MKLKHVYYSIAFIFVIMGLVVWKLNDAYSVERSSVKASQLKTQTTSLRSSVSSQLSQLKNILSEYAVAFDESQINWVQLKPFYVLAQVQEDAQNRLFVQRMYTQSGAAAERWTNSSLQQMLQQPSKSNQLIRAIVFKDTSNVKHLGLIFFEQEKRKNISARSGLMVVGDASYFQRFYDLQRTSHITQALMTSDQVVAAHSEYEYVGSLSKEAQIVSNEKFFSIKEDVRGSNLVLVGYASRSASAGLSIPFSVLGLILGFGFFISGILLYLARPETKEFAATHSNTQSASSTLDKQIVLTDRPRAQPTQQAQQDVQRIDQQQDVSLAKPVHAPTVAAKTVIAVDAFVGVGGEFKDVVVHTFLQQAIFNLDRQFKSASVLVVKDFSAVDVVNVDYAKLVKVFEFVLEQIVEKMLPGNVKNKIFIRSYDQDDKAVIEIQAAVALNLNPILLDELAKAGCLMNKDIASAGSTIFKFSFAKAQKELFTSVAVSATQGVQQSSYDLTPPIKTEDELDIDAILQLEDVAEDLNNNTTNADVDMPIEKIDKVKTDKAKIDLEKEMQTTKYKLDMNIAAVPEPTIDESLLGENQEADKFQVKIRRPEKA